jgi:HEAT repeat
MPRLTPRQRVEAECARRGQTALVAGCVDILEGNDVDDGLVVALGEEQAEYVLSGREGGRDGYWPRVWAARALLYAWDDTATEAILVALGDESWRVRETAARVVARHRVEAAAEVVRRLQGDPVPRVRAAADRAAEVVGA